MNASEFCQWVKASKPGEKIEYYRGFLAVNRGMADHQDNLVVTNLMDMDRADLVCLAHWARQAADEDRVHLVQRKVGDSDYVYIAVARGKVPYQFIPHTVIHRQIKPIADVA